MSEGDDVHFLCLHSDSLPAANLYWTHNSQEISPGDSPRLRVSTSVLSSTQVTSTLSISAVELNDAGQYVCLAINPVLLGSAVESAPATLTVQGERVGQGVSRALCSLLFCPPPLAVPKAPSFTADPSSLILPFPGGTVTFACSSAGYPPPSVDWLHNGVPVTAGTRVSVTMVGAESQLRVVNVVEADTGSYQCVANNSLGQVISQTASLTIASEFVGGLVVRPPTAIQPPSSPSHLAPPTAGIGTDFILPPPDTEAVLSLDVAVPCGPPPSTPPANVSWTKSFSQLNPQRFTVAPNNSLVIRSVQLEDAGEYYCVATNPVSMASRIGGPSVVTVLSESCQQSLRCDSLSLGSSRHEAMRSIPYHVERPSLSPPLCLLTAPPSMTQRPQNISAPVDSAAIFTCVASGNPAPSITWSDPTNLIIQNSSRFSLSDGELRLFPVGRGDSGEYTCHAHSRAGTAMSSAFLDVQCECQLPLLPQ